MLEQILEQITLKDAVLFIYSISVVGLFIWRTLGFIMYPKNKSTIDSVVSTLFVMFCPIYNTYFLIARLFFNDNHESDFPEANVREMKEIEKNLELITNIIEQHLDCKIEPDSTLKHFLSIAAMDSFYIGKGCLNDKERYKLLVGGSYEKRIEKEKERGANVD